jgi:hypothetical protein
MAATVCPAPQFVGLDNSGNPLSGGKLYSYSAGTTTNLNTFSDSDLSVANANPIILDAGGRATVYLSASSYKFKLTSSGDDVIYTQDNVISSAPYDVDLDVPFVAGEAVTAGQAIYLSDGTGSRTAGRWYLTDSDTAAYSTLPITGFAVAAVALAATGSVRLLGRASVPGTLSVGSTYYLGATPGALSSSAGTFSKAMGVADTASTLVMTVQQTISQVVNLLVTGTLTVNGVATFDVKPILSSLTASLAVFSDGSKGLVSNAITGTGNVVMSASPTLTGTIGAAAMTLSTPLVVGSGGSGVASHTAYGVIVGGTGTTAATQTITPGDSGTILTSGGTGGVPTWGAAATQVIPQVIQSTAFETAARFTETNVSGGNSTFNTQGVELDTSATISSSTQIKWNLVRAENAGGLFTTFPAQFGAFLGIDTFGTDRQDFYGLGTPTVGASGITYTDDHIGVKIVRASSGTTTVSATTALSSTESATALTTVVADDTVDVCIELVSASSIKFYYRKNGSTWSAATEITTNIPTSTAMVAASFAISNSGVATRTAVKVYSAYYLR